MDFTILLYIFTFLIGIFLDFPQNKQYTRFRKIFIVWLYIFLCFGYMTGSDWRPYETHFYSLKYAEIKGFDKELGFWFVFWLIKQVIPDYWLVVGLLKSIYLFSLIKLLKKITPYWITTVVILMPISLTFLLIDNPLRFMCALIFTNIAMIYLVDKRYWISILFLLVSILFHQTTIFFLTIPLCFLLANKIARANRIILLALYIVMFIVSYNLQSLTMIFNQVSLFFDDFVDMDSYHNYGLNNEGILAIGNISPLIFFICVLLTRNIIKGIPNGNIIYSLTVIYFLLQRFCNFMETGFRLVIPFGYLFAILIATLFCRKQIIGYLFVAYYLLAFSINTWNSWKMIPYSNSIPYIIIGHKPFQERNTYNIQKYQERTGKAIDYSY